MNHCKDCCCTHLWKALDIDHYTGKSLVEHVGELRAKLTATEARVRELREALLERVMALRKNEEESATSSTELFYTGGWNDAIDAARAALREEK